VENKDLRNPAEIIRNFWRCLENVGFQPEIGIGCSKIQEFTSKKED
jgi:hypothetical protein